MNIRLSAGIWLLLLMLAGCATVPSPPPQAEVYPANSNVVKMKVYFATDRNILTSANPPKIFGVDRSDTVKFGVCQVAIPRAKRAGEPERPIAWRLEYQEKPVKEATLVSTSAKSKEEFRDELSAGIGRLREENLLFFIHGYNVTFEEAAARTAKMVYDLGFEGVAAFYSWPSRGEKLDYMADEATIEWSQPYIKTFLEELLVKSEAKNIYLVAHSMGNRGMTRSLASLFEEKPGAKKRIRQVILAAPDIDSWVFRRDIAPALARAEKPVTLYASSNDKALQLSQKLHKFPRAGEAGDGLVLADGIETIDVSSSDTDFLNHSYIANDPDVVADMHDIIVNGLKADKRARLFSVTTPEGKYWKLKK